MNSVKEVGIKNRTNYSLNLDPDTIMINEK